MISLLVTLLIICLIAYVVWWALSQIPMPEPIRVVVIVIFAIILILILVRLIPGVNIGI